MKTFCSSIFSSDESLHKAIGKEVALWGKEKAQWINGVLVEYRARVLKSYRSCFLSQTYHFDSSNKHYFMSTIY